MKLGRELEVSALDGLSIGVTADAQQSVVVEAIEVSKDFDDATFDIGVEVDCLGKRKAIIAFLMVAGGRNRVGRRRWLACRGRWGAHGHFGQKSLPENRDGPARPVRSTEALRARPLADGVLGLA